MRTPTNLPKIKRIAHTLLNTDIKLTNYSPVIVKHPFTNSGISAVRGENGNLVMVDLVNKPEDLAAWRKQVGGLIDSSKSAYEVYLMVDKTYSLAFIKFAEPFLSDQDLGQILSSAWIANEAPSSDPNINKRNLVSLFRSIPHEYLMDAEELQQLEELEDPVTIYRGVRSEKQKHIKNLSWTLDREKAEWFAHRFSREGTVYEAQIEKKHILALFNGRGESEVVVDPKYLQNLTVAMEQEQGFQMGGMT